jgi:hypothetical protein
MTSAPFNPVHEAIDSAYERLVATLPARLTTVARDLPYRFGLTPNPGTPWSRVFNNAAVLGFPALLLSAQRVPKEIRQRAIAAHLFAIIAAFGQDRIDDGQITVGAAEYALIDIIREARDRALTPLLAKAPELKMTFACGEELTAQSVDDERCVFTGKTPATLDLYRQVSWKKQGLAFPATMVAVAAAGFDSEEKRHVEALVTGAALGLQYRDDVVDWMDDFMLGASWPVELLQDAVDAMSIQEVEQRLHAERTLVGLLEMSYRAFQEAALAAEALGATALASWAHGQAEVTGNLAEKELVQLGYAVQWERTRRAQRERQQALLVANVKATAMG